VRIFHIVDSDHSNAFGDSSANSKQRMHQIAGGMVVGANECGWSILLHHGLYEY
jgi:hypothetical protein